MGREGNEAPDSGLRGCLIGFQVFTGRLSERVDRLLHKWQTKIVIHFSWVVDGGGGGGGNEIDRTRVTKGCILMVMILFIITGEEVGDFFFCFWH